MGRLTSGSINVYNFNAENEILHIPSTIDLKIFYHDPELRLCDVCYERYKRGCEKIIEFYEAREEYNEYKKVKDKQLELDKIFEGYYKSKKWVEDYKKSRERYLEARGKCKRCANRKLWCQINLGSHKFDTRKLKEKYFTNPY